MFNRKRKDSSVAFLLNADFSTCNGGAGVDIDTGNFDIWTESGRAIIFNRINRTSKIVSKEETPEFQQLLEANSGNPEILEELCRSFGTKI